MKSRSGQMSFRIIIGAIIAIVVLSLILSYTTGTLGRLFGETRGAEEAISDTSIVAAKTKCQNWCLEAQNVQSVDDWENSRFCTENARPNGDKCTSDNVGATCTVIIDGSDKTEDDCS